MLSFLGIMQYARATSQRVGTIKALKTLFVLNASPHIINVVFRGVTLPKFVVSIANLM
jgi:hypothetical protein